MSNPLVVIVSFTAEPGQEHRLRTELDAVVEPTRAEQGCISYQPYLHPNDPGRVIVVEEWTDDTTFERHIALPRSERIAALGIFAEPITIRKFTGGTTGSRPGNR
ncbi:putative quinol monooxygenase [Nocardia sp. NPDC050175]|uniref:putative quinol monooxygenase n=1 Tax=Nocardia sp. NPDC050175 TaxID=3364317 RepID=UPI0037B80131